MWLRILTYLKLFSYKNRIEPVMKSYIQTALYPISHYTGPLYNGVSVYLIVILISWAMLLQESSYIGEFPSVSRFNQERPPSFPGAQWRYFTHPIANLRWWRWSTGPVTATAVVATGFRCCESLSKSGFSQWRVDEYVAEYRVRRFGY